MEERILLNGSRHRRSENFTNTEKLLMLKILENFVDITENKATDGQTCKQKELAWHKVASSFNKSTTGLQRALPQLQSLWKNMKQKLKTQAEMQEYKSRTGQAPPAEKMLQMMKKVYDVQPTDHASTSIQLEIRTPSDVQAEVQPLYNPYDCDAGDPPPVDMADVPNGRITSPLDLTFENSDDVVTLTEVSEDSPNQLYKMAQEEHNLKVKLLKAKLHSVNRRLEMEEEVHVIKMKKLKESWALT